MYRVQLTVYSIQLTVYSIQLTVYSLQLQSCFINSWFQSPGKSAICSWRGWMVISLVSIQDNPNFARFWRKIIYCKHLCRGTKVILYLTKQKSKSTKHMFLNIVSIVVFLVVVFFAVVLFSFLLITFFKRHAPPRPGWLGRVQWTAYCGHS